MEEKKLRIEIQHPEQELRVLANAISLLSEPNLDRSTIRHCRKIIKEAQATRKIVRAYTEYLDSRVKVLERQISELER